jgi:hypothetical protein
MRQAKRIVAAWMQSKSNTRLDHSLTARLMNAKNVLDAVCDHVGILTQAATAVSA